MEFCAFQADLSKEEEVIKMTEQIIDCGEVYGLVNNAGVCLFEDLFSITPESFDYTFAVNVKSVFLLTQKISEHMVRMGTKGRIVNFSSITAVSGSATQVHYGAAKSAVSGMTHMLAEALGPYDITVNAIMPGSIPTKHNSAFLKNEDVKADLCSRILLKRYGNPENIADAVIYFLGERAAWTTGTTLPVDGGYLAK